MHKIDGAGHVNNTFVNEDVATNRPPTEFTMDWFNAIQAELVNVVEGSGAALNKPDNTQLLTAIKALINGGDYKASVRVASTAAINLAAPGANIDGVAMVAGDRFLEKDNATLANRGIYIWNGAAVPATRATDADTGAELNGGAIIPVEEGTANADTNWQLTNNGTVTIGTTGLTFQQVGAAPTVASIQGAFKNLKASATGLSANVTVTADEIAVEDAANSYKTLRAVNLTIAGTASGAANGLDTGALAASTWYSMWVIWNGATTSGLLSLSDTAPTLPSGYTHKARVGWMRTDASGNKYPLSFIQAGRDIQYKVTAGSNLTGLPRPISGTQGNTSTPTWVAVPLGAFIPPTAEKVKVSLIGAATLNQSAMAAPNNSYGAYSSLTNPPPIIISNGTSVNSSNISAEFVLESSSIYFAASGTLALAVLGWTDNI